MSRTGIKRLGLLLPLAALLAFSYSSALGQTSQASQTSPAPPPLTPNEQRNESRPFATMEEEMRAKREIQSAEKAYKDNLNRARDLATLGASICNAYKTKNYLDREDIKKLDRAEKLTKNIRDAFGGSTDDTSIEKPPADLATATTQLADLTGSLKEKVEKTPKRVVSTAVIDEANVLLELIRIVRGMQPKT